MAVTYDQALASSAPRIGIFLRFGFASPVRLWLGIGNITATIDATDGSGATYSGIGEVVGLPALQQLINAKAERVEFRLSGVSQSAVSMATTEADDVKGIALNVGVGVFGADWQLVQEPTWVRRLIIDYLSTSTESTEAGQVRTVSVSARSAFTGRRRPTLSFYTDAEQRQRSADDRFCERASLYSSETIKAWPVY